MDAQGKQRCPGGASGLGEATVGGFTDRA